MSANRPPTSVRITLGLILLQAAFWLVFAALVALGAVGGIPHGWLRWAMAVLALGCAALLAALATFLWRRKRPAFYAALALLALLALLSITDQVGALDVATLLASLVAIGGMIKDRGWYLGR